MDRDDKRLAHFKSRSTNSPYGYIWNSCNNNYNYPHQNTCDLYEIDWDKPNMQIDDVRFRYLGTSPLQSAYVGSCLRRLEYKCAKANYEN